jgi:hypothetical protein
MVLPLLFAVLTAAPSRAAGMPDCLGVAKSSSTMARPATFDQLKACQDRVRKDVPKARVEALEEHQRAEARTFFADPSHEISGAPEAAAPDEAAAAAPRDKGLPAHARPGQLGGPTAADLSRLGGGDAASIGALEARLHAAAGTGENGVTPAMADDIRATLTRSQGSVSPQMQALLDAVAHDGGKLTSGTMKKLQEAGRAAKGEGMDLNIDPTMEKELLNHDFDSDKKKDAAAPGSL